MIESLDIAEMLISQPDTSWLRVHSMLWAFTEMTQNPREATYYISKVS